MAHKKGCIKMPFVLFHNEWHYNTALSQEILLEGLIYPFKAINP